MDPWESLKKALKWTPKEKTSRVKRLAMLISARGRLGEIKAGLKTGVVLKASILILFLNYIRNLFSSFDSFLKVFAGF